MTAPMLHTGKYSSGELHGSVGETWRTLVLSLSLKHICAYYVYGTGRQTLVKDKTANDNYYLLTLAALAQEIRKRKVGKDCFEDG